MEAWHTSDGLSSKLALCHFATCSGQNKWQGQSWFKGWGNRPPDGRRCKSHCKDVGYGTGEDYVHVFKPPQRLQNIAFKLINENCIEGSNKTGKDTGQSSPWGCLRCVMRGEDSWKTFQDWMQWMAKGRHWKLSIEWINNFREWTFRATKKWSKTSIFLKSIISPRCLALIWTKKNELFQVTRVQEYK